MFKTVVAATCASAALAWQQYAPAKARPVKLLRQAPKQEFYPRPTYQRGPRDFEAGKEIRGLKNFEKKLDIRNKKDLNLNLKEIEGRGNFEKDLDIDNKKELNLGLGEIEQNGDIDFNLDFERRGDFEAKGESRRGQFNSYGIHRQAPGPVKPRGVVGIGYGRQDRGGASSRQATDNYGGSGGKGGLVDIGNKFDTRSIQPKHAPAPKQGKFQDIYGLGSQSQSISLGGSSQGSLSGYGQLDRGHGAVRSYSSYDDYDTGYGQGGYQKRQIGGYGGYGGYGQSRGYGGYGGSSYGGYGGYGGYGSSRGYGGYGGPSYGGYGQSRGYGGYGGSSYGGYGRGFSGYGGQIEAYGSTGYGHQGGYGRRSYGY